MIIFLTIFFHMFLAFMLCNFSVRMLRYFFFNLKICFCPQKVEKTTPKSCILIAVGSLFVFLSAALTAQNSPELHFCFINSFIQSSLLESLVVKQGFTYLESMLHCKPKPCKAYRELPVSQFSQGKTCFHYREPCSHCRDSVFITGISLQTPLLPFYRIAVYVLIMTLLRQLGGSK